MEEQSVTTGQSDSLELMFTKFATAKNRKQLNPLKVITNRCYLPKNITEVGTLGLKPPTFKLHVQH